MSSAIVLHWQVDTDNSQLVLQPFSGVHKYWKHIKLAWLTHKTNSLCTSGRQVRNAGILYTAKKLCSTRTIHTHKWWLFKVVEHTVSIWHWSHLNQTSIFCHWLVESCDHLIGQKCLCM